MSNLIDIIAQKYDEMGLKEIKVPEWGCSIYCRTLTAAERANIRKGHPESDEEGLIISALMSKALDKDGKRLFEDDAKTRATLTGKAEVEVITRIVLAMGQSDLDGDLKNA